MNSIVAFVIAAIVSLSTFLSVPFDELEKGFAEGDATSILDSCGEKIIITIDKKEGVYSKTQATHVLKTFFTNYPPKTFVFVYKKKEQGVNSFAVGNYISDKEQFKISLRMKLLKSTHRIESITIDKE